MGVGIKGGIFITFREKAYGERLSDAFSTYYNLIEQEGIAFYQIKEEVLLPNFKDFLNEFNTLLGIEEIGYGDEALTIDDIPDFETLDEFKDFWSREARNATTPFTDSRTSFYPTDGLPLLTWFFYDGTYKVFLEDYRTLYHFELALKAAIKNPLAKLIKLGEFG